MTENQQEIASIIVGNEDITDKLYEMREKTTHTNITMILDFFIETLEVLKESLEGEKKMDQLKEYEDMKISEHMKTPYPDPESLQSVLLYTAEIISNEFKRIGKMDTKNEKIQLYNKNMDNLRKRAEHLYHDLVERYK